jgi:UrcA family protein
MKFAAIFAAAALFTGAFAAPALAADTMPATQIVRTYDINMTTESGADQMLRRIRYAARAVCGVNGGIVSLSQRANGRACVREATADAVRQLNQPMVTAVYAERTGGAADWSMGAR